MKTAITTLLMALTTLAHAQSIVGKWKSFDDKTGELKSIVEITERNAKVVGHIIQIFPKAGQKTDPLCDKCPANDPRYNARVIGMEIIKDMIKDDDEYVDGTILDPEVGKIYRCKLWLENGELKVRGYLGPFFRTQTWRRDSHSTGK